MQSRIEMLESRVATLELQVNQLRRHVFETTGAPSPRPSVPIAPKAPPRQIEAPPPAPMRETPAITLEAFFGGRLLLGAGVLAFLFGVAFFLKYAFDTGWIGPTGRVAMGLIGGIAIMFAGDRVFRREQQAYAAALTGLGSAILYLSLWAAGSYFHLAPIAFTFAAMVIVTAATMTVAIRRNAEALAIVSVVGALLTPALNAAQATNLTVLFAYLAIVNLVLLWLPIKRWPRLEALAFAGTQLYVLIEMPANVAAWSADIAVTLIFATTFLLQFTAMPLLRAYRSDKPAPYELVMTLVCASLYYLVLCDQLYVLHRHWLTAASVILAIAYLAIAYFMRGSMRQACAGAALAFITIGTGITFTGASMAIAWSVEGALLLIVGTRTQSVVTRLFGYAAYLAMVFALQAAHLSGVPLFLNERFATLLVTAIGLGAVAFASQDAFDETFMAERYLPKAAEALAHFFMLLALGFELDAAFHGSALAVSLLMLVYAALLVGIGFVAKRLFTRWEGLALFGVLVLKVFFVDLSTLDTVVRIVSFLAVGSVLLITALLYQRTQARQSQGT